MKTFLITLLTLSLLLFQLGCESKSEPPAFQKSEVIPVKTITLLPDSGNHTITAAGQFTTDDEVDLSFKITGIISAIFVKTGDLVKKGQLLATLDLTEINTQVERASLAYEKAKRDHQRLQNLHKDSVATLEQLQNSHTALELALQQFNAALFNKSHAEIRATKDGYVLAKLANAGQLMEAGTPVLRTNGARSEHWLLRVGLSDKEWALVQLHDSAEVHVASVSDHSFKGTVIHKARGIDPLSGSFIVDIKLDKKVSAIASGMFGKALIKTSGIKYPGTSTSWAIPYDALLDGDGSTGYVFITNNGKTAKKLKVTIAEIEKDQIIINKGLENAKKLIISGSAYLTDNSAIQIVD